MKAKKLPPNHPDTFDETGYVKDEYNQLKNSSANLKKFESDLQVSWDKVRDIFENVDYFKELKEYEKYEVFLDFLDANFTAPELKFVKKEER